jgi:hypothetical protein
MTFFPSFISISVIVTPHVHALSCKSRAFLTRWRRIPIALELGGTSVLGARLGGSSDVVARAIVVGTVAAGSGVGVVFAVAV